MKMNSFSRPPLRWDYAVESKQKQGGVKKMRTIEFHGKIDMTEPGNIKFNFDNAFYFLRHHIDDIEEVNRNQRVEIQKLTNRIQQLEAIEKEYNEVMKLLNKARTMAFLTEDPPPKQTFVMERNGNLEKKSNLGGYTL